MGSAIRLSRDPQSEAQWIRVATRKAATIWKDYLSTLLITGIRNQVPQWPIADPLRAGYAFVFPTFPLHPWQNNSDSRGRIIFATSSLR
jgi:hypothetical protein